jgi:hypothetical protein
MVMRLRPTHLHACSDVGVAVAVHIADCGGREQARAWQNYAWALGIAEFTSMYAIEADFKAKVEGLFNPMIDDTVAAAPSATAV